jgi:tetratricopeptide (TPR) repeat protein
MKRGINIYVFYIIMFILMLAAVVSAQTQLTAPQVSQKASVSQTIGLTDITISYHGPKVNGREIWGKLVPYNEVWRGGANENTTISFTDPVKIEGQDIPAGTYGLHFIPAEKEWTVIFSKNYWSWGSFNYDQKDDQLRVTVKPVSADFQEWLSYTFDNPTENSVDAVLRWEKIRIPVRITLDVHELVLDHMKKELDNLPGFFWQGWNQIASYAFMNNTHLSDAMKWIDKSIGLNKNFTNQMTKAGLLEATGKKAEADELNKSVMTTATEAEVNTYGYQLLQRGKTDEAIELFIKNTKDHPDSWNVWDSLGEAYGKKGDNDMAVKYYSKAYGMAPDNQKSRIKGILKNLGKDI